MYSDITGAYPVLNNNIPSSFVISNHVNKMSQSIKLIYDPYLSTIFGNVSYTITESEKSAGLFYTYSCVGTSSLNYGAGVNLGGWLGVYGYISTPAEIGVGVQITPWAHTSGQIGLSGVGFSLGIDIGNTAHDISVNIGWGSIGLIAIASLPIPGARTVAAAAALMLIFVGFVEYGDGGYYL